MTQSSRRSARRLAKVLLVSTSLGLAGIGGELVLRVAGGYRLLRLRLEPAHSGTKDPAAALDLAPDLAAAFAAHWQQTRPDLDIGWLRTSPPPLPAQPALGQPLLPQHDWLLHYYVTNAALLRAMWVKGQGLPMLPGLRLPDVFTVFEPPGGKLAPRYRYPASRTLPTGLVTNRYGFRGRDLPVDKPDHTVRIAFVGASTTVEAHGLPHSAPELVEHWLGAWATSRRLPVRFETLNAAREAIQSADLRAIVEDELLPLEVDYVVYYEGANQFQPPALLRHVAIDGDYSLAEPPPGIVGAYDDTRTADSTLLDRAAAWSATARYARAALQRGKVLTEPPKPPQRLTVPSELLAAEFPLARAAEVLQCGAIDADLTAIGAALRRHDARLVIATFWWLAADGLELDAVLGHNVHVHLNRAYWPFRYGTIRALADLQNRFFTAWAKAHDAELLDVAAQLPHDPRLAIDAIHHNEIGVRLKAWILFAGLVRILERDLAAGRLPVPDRHADPVHPHIGPTATIRRIDLDAR